jgi:hypothetical protein
MNTLLLVAALTVSQQAKPATPAEIEAKTYQVLLGAAPAIDQCTAAYSAEYPAEVGKVQLALTVQKDGSVAQVTAATTLQGARNLRPCLESVAKKWKLPAINTESEKLALTITVKKGVKFTLKKPGEKAAEGQTQSGAQEESGFLQFTPEGFTPNSGGN